ncbi:nuclear transport factor 2 family protein [Mycobacterium sp. IS-1264]|uniref:BTAD domain-containing putative transcriptional regulator n=1 Tax=Mycobacterium sp. IS-1264 TaxID=1834158 RepID=UPI001F0A86C4|nr:nuclear transport factor 2 family protein [Mycobacterium sp. IS-1264]
MELGVLGPLQVRHDGAPVVIPGAKPRAILTMLGLHSASVVSADTLVELLWGEDPPRTAAKALQTHISSLRRTLGDGFILTQGAGWILAESEVDVSRYKAAARLGRDAAAAGDISQAAAHFEEALALWRGIPELPDGRRGTSEKTRWIEGHAALVEDRADALLATGRAAEIVGELEAAVADAPLRERRWGQLMLALYRAGRQGEALGAYQRARALLADELGVDPGPDLRRLEAAIVAQDTSLEIPAAQQPSVITRAVTFLLTDIEGSTAAWEAEADAMAVALARHDELVEQVVTSRGGRLIKTRGEGDATFSVFERPSAAASAAIELQEAIVQEPWVLREPMRIRVALHTGEAELRDGDYFGRAVNRAARLRSLAVGGQILCSGATAELVIDSLADDVVLADLGMRELRNLARPEHVFELRLETAENQRSSVPTDVPVKRPSLPAVLAGPGPFVGRGRELERLFTAWQAALAGGTNAVLIAGEPGVGKTRLAGEWSRQAYDQGALVIYGRCDEDLGAPYQPFAEALRSLVPCLGSGGLRGLRGVEALLALVPGLSDVLPDLAMPTRADPDTERYALFDAVVGLLGIASAGAPIILILDDLHWAAKPTLLLLRHLLRFGEHARVQIVGTYRSTDLDRSHPLAAMLADLHRDGTADRLQLGGLDEDDVSAYVAEAGYDDEELARALASVTGGNPFFLIEALRHVDESGGRWDQSTLPQGVREAVSRRLSRLAPETNKALAAAAVVGSRFALDLVESVVGDDLVDALDEACKAGIVIEEHGGRYRFNHAIVRQSLLAELPSVRRMRLHQRIATTLESQPGADEERLAELAHHYFECAWAGNAAKAVEYCRRAADQAMTRLAYEGAAELYDRALHALEEIDDELPDRDDQTAELLIARCEALLAAGDVASAAGAVSQLQGATVDSARLAAWATCFDGQLSMLTHPERLDEVEAALGDAATKLAELDDAAGEATAHTVRAGCLARLGRIGDCEVALDDALTAARRAQEHRRVNNVLANAPLAALWGPNPVPRAGGRCLDVVRLLRITTDSPAVEATSTRCQAVLEAFRGRAAAARRMIDSARRTVTELGLRHALLEVEHFAGLVELVVDDPGAAESHLRQAYNGFRRMGIDVCIAETAALLGRACLALDRDDEADELCTESERLAGSALKASIAWGTLRALLLSRSGDHDAARRVAEAAVSLAERTDALVDHGDACLTLATVLAAAGDSAGARGAAERSVDLYERKGAAALAETARQVLGERVPHPAATPPETPAVELDTAAVRVGEHVMAAIHREAWDEVERLFAPDLVVESRRKIVGLTLLSDAVRGGLRRELEAGTVRINHVMVAARGERLALSRLITSSPDASPGAPQDELLQLYAINEDGQVALQVWFDVEDIDAAMAELDALHARLEELHPRAPLENAATRAYERLHAYFAARDWDAITELLTDDYYGDDRRSVVGSGIRRGPDAAIEDFRSAADIEVTDASSDTVATRGARLALTRARYSRTGQESEGFHVDFLQIVEIDTDERIAAMPAFDLDDFDAAIAELDARYLVGEAAAHSHTWSVIAHAYDAARQHKLPAMTPDCVTIDHRRAKAFAPGEMTEYIRAGWDLDQTIRTYVEVVHRLSDLGAVCTYAAHGLSHEGFHAEWREIAISTVEGDMVNRCELFDDDELDAALARFEELNRPASKLENDASRVFERLYSYVAAGDWHAVAQITAENVSVDDRRRVVNAGIIHGRDANIKDAQATADVGFTMTMVGVLATRGSRLALTRVRVSGRDPEAIENDSFSIIEIDVEERIAAVVVFDLDNFETAIAELDARYIAGEAAAHSRTWSVIMQAYEALNRREMPPTTPGWVNIDHRRGTSFASGEMPALLDAVWNLTTDLSHSIEAVQRLNDFGAVITNASHETSREGFDAEWRVITVVTVEGDMLSRCEVFDQDDLDAAIARFDELRPQTRRLENTAARVYERILAHFAARDWDAITQILAEDVSTEDRRRVVNAGLRHGQDAVVAEIAAIAEVGTVHLASEILATRGERLVLTRGRASAGSRGPDAFRSDLLDVVEIDSDERVVGRVIFDPDDFDAAIAELDARYIAGEAAPHAQTWSVIASSYAAINRHEQPPTTPDWVNVDHRREIAMGPDGLVAYIKAGLDSDQDITCYVETVHRLNGDGAVVSYAAHETSREGFNAEWRGVVVLLVDGEMVSRSELFDEMDLDAAVSRFEQLSRSAQRLENAASQVTERLLTALTAGESDAMAEILAEDFCADDRRRVVGAGVRHGRFAAIADAQAIASLGIANAASTVMATRGERLVLFCGRYSLRDQGPEAFLGEVLSIVEIDTDSRIVGYVTFDLDDFDAAMAELDARYLAGEAAPHAHTWSVITGSYAALNRHEMPAATPDGVTMDHRRGGAFAPGELTAYIRAAWDTAPEATIHVEVVHRLSSLGAVVTEVAQGVTVDGFDAEWRDIAILTVDGGLLSRGELFDEADLDAAIAKFEQLSRRTPRLENAASEAYGRFRKYFAARDWAAMAELLTADTSVDDHRRVVNAEIRRGRDVEIANMQAFAEIGATRSIATAIATRGERLVLCRTCISGEEQQPGAFNIEFLNLVEITADKQIAARSAFDLDDIDAAFEELDARYLASEARAHANTWRVLTDAFAAINRHELPQLAANWINIDHRRGAAFATGDMTAYIHDLFNDAPDINVYVEVVHRLTDLGVVITQVAHGTSRTGFQAEWREIAIITVEGDLLGRCELFDETDLDAAIARFDELQPEARRLKNAASQVFERLLAHFASGDWDAIPGLLADDFLNHDRRRVVGAGVHHGRDAQLDDMRAIANLGITDVRPTEMATRGGNLVLSRVRFLVPDQLREAFLIEALCIVEVKDGQIVAFISFDVDDIDAAFEELDARYIAGEAALYASVWKRALDILGEVNRHEPGPMIERLAFTDHRRVPFADGDFRRAIEELWPLVSDARYRATAVHALGAHGVVASLVIEGTDAQGNELQWARALLLDPDEPRLEIYEESDLDRALARFEELRPEARHLKNAATRTYARLWKHFMARDWAAVAETIAHDIVDEDGRRLVGHGTRHGRDAEMENLRVTAELGITNVTPTVTATRGERLALHRVRFSGLDQQQPGAFFNPVLRVVGTDADERIAIVVLFDPDDIDSAFKELDARYLAGEATVHGHTWSVIMHACAALNRREIFATTANFVDIDHRSLAAIGSGDLKTYMHAALNDGAYNVYVEAVHRLTDLGAVVTLVSNGTSQEGFEGEWRMADIFTVEGDLINRCEIFDEADLDAALARFDELHPQTRHLENAASLADDRFFAHTRTRNWAAASQILADSSFVDDRRRVVNIGVWDGRDTVIANIRALADALTDVTSMVIAIRGERLGLTRISAPNRKFAHGDFRVEMLCVVELDTDDRIAAHVMFDTEDIGAAFDELEARYLAGEAGPYAHTWSVVTRSYAMLNRRELPPRPDFIDQRRGVSVAPGDLTAFIGAAWELERDICNRIENVHRLNKFGAVVTRVSNGTSQEGLEAEWRSIDVLIVDGDLVNRLEVFDEADLDAALARFDELHPRVRGLENAASQAVERLWSCFAARDWAEMAETMADDIVTHDHRRVVSADVLCGRDDHVTNMQAVAEVGFEGITSTVVATRGRRLALIRIQSSVHGFEPGETSAEMLSVVEVGGDNRLTASAIFDGDDIDAAFEELDARYLAGEAAAHSHAWSVLADECAAFNRHEITAADYITVDHRPLPLIEADSQAALQVWEVTPDFSIHIEAVHRLSRFGAVATYTAYGTSPEGFDAEWRPILLLIVDGDRINRCEVFDEADLDSALMRFDELNRPPLLDNAATRIWEGMADAFKRRDINGFLALCTADIQYQDRRKGLRDEFEGKAQQRIAVQAMFETAPSGFRLEVEPIATRGSRLSLIRVCYRDTDHADRPVAVELLQITEVTEAGLLHYSVTFDLDDINAAVAELDARYVAGEAAAHSRVWSAITQVIVTLNRGEIPAIAPDFKDIDRRGGPTMTPGDLIEYLRASFADSVDITIYVEAVHRLTSLGAVVTHVAKGTTQAGFYAEWRMTDVFTVEDDLLNRCEFFDDAHLDDALARFDELSAPAPSLVEADPDVGTRP